MDDVTFLGMPEADAVLRSSLDRSVNLVEPLGPGEAFEARFVRRGPGYVVVYLSAQSACGQACRFCHLTATGQVSGRDATVGEIFGQARSVLDLFAAELAAGRAEPAPRVNFNFMARGEPLSSAVVLAHGDDIVEGLGAIAAEHQMRPVVRFSTIAPSGMPPLADIFTRTSPELYFSVYSLDESFRRRWLPNAGDPYAFLDQLAAWQRQLRHIPVLHHAVIDGANSDLSHVEQIIAAVDERDLRVDVNLVRYNPPSPRHGVEADEATLEAHVAAYRAAWPAANVRLIPRVGFDVAASCGMFVADRPAAAR